MSKVTGVLLDVSQGALKNGNKPQVVTVEDELSSYYEILNCRCIDITQRKIGGKLFDIVCDDEALLVDDPVMSAVSTDFEPMLAGNLFICKVDDEGNLVSLTTEEQESVLGCIYRLRTMRHPNGYYLLTHCDYDYWN